MTADDEIPGAPFDDLDLDTPEGEEEWERRTFEMATRRVGAALARLRRLGILDENNRLRSNEMPRGR